MKFWPTPRGNHRGALRANGPGARHGRERWRWEADSRVYGALAGMDTLVVIGETSLDFLDGDGTPVAFTPLLEEASPVALIGDVVVVRDGTTLSAWRPGALAWIRDLGHPVVATGVTPDDALLVWTRDARVRPARHELRRIEADGTVRWTTPLPFSCVGHPLEWAIVCDDNARIYAGARTRLGDGVSGNDVREGGIAAFDGPDLVWTAPRPSDDLCALASGFATHAYATQAFAADGSPTWSLGRDDAHILPITGLEGGLCWDPRLRDIPRRLHRFPNGNGTGLRCVSDPDGWSWIGRQPWSPPRVDRLYGLTPDADVAWILDVDPEPFSTAVHAVGPGGTVLYARGNTLIALE